MKKYLLVLVFLLPTTTFASVITGTLATSQIWTVAGGPYEVDALTIPLGVTLTIEPGTQIVPVLKWSNEPTYIFKVEGVVFFGSNTGPKIIVAPPNPPLPPYPTNGTLREQLEWAAFGVQIRPSASLFLIQSTGSVILQNTETNNINIVIENKGGIVEVDGLKSRNYQFSLYQRGLYQGGIVKGSTNIINSDLFGRGIQEMDVVGGTLTVHNTKLVGISSFGSPYNIQAAADLSNNWWGRSLGPDSSIFQGQSIIFTPWLTTEPGSAPVGCTVNCYSSVMFFPGIMGSRLYENVNGAEVERWASSNDTNQVALGMDSNGYSINSLYTKAATSTNTGVIDEILGQNIYKSFMSDLAQMKANSTIGIDYSLIPYDWRLPLSEIVQKGKVEGDKIYYGANVPNISDSFIIKELQRLADNSKSGKVTIVAHSNGGLVTKELIQTLKEINSPLYEKIDKVIMVAVPQAGTPDAMTTMLHGTSMGSLLGMYNYANAKRTRDLFQNMPSMYNLLPNESFFNNLSPLIEFGGSSPDQANINVYGTTINTYQEYLDYLKGTEGRTAPSYSDTLNPAKANQILLNQSIATHQRIDSWLPATSTKVYQVAGWGIYTPSGIKYTDYKQCVILNPSTGDCAIALPKTTLSDQLKLNGDGTVLSGSAQAMVENSQVKNWWVDVRKYNESNFGITRNRDHKSILEIDSLRTFIKNLVTNGTSSTQYLSRTEPSLPNNLDGQYTTYRIHSPLHLTVIDSQGNITGYSTSTNQILEQIKGSQYLESADVKTVILPKDTPHKVILTAYDSGSFTFESSTLSGNAESPLTVFEAIPTSTSTVATLINTGTEVSTSTPLTLDFDGNGTTDKTVITQTGQTTMYDVTPPELRLTFSTSTKDVIFSAVDTLDSNPSLTVGTSTITMKDNQNNTTIINFIKLKDNPTKLVLKYNTITRNGVSTTTPNTRIEYDWRLDSQDNLKDLDTRIVVKGLEKIVFNYKKQSNATTIKTKNIVTGGVSTVTRTGFVPVTIITSKDNLLDISY